MKFMITEEWTGYFHYHISNCDTFTKPICGKDITTMQTSIPLDTWGVITHLKEKYCDKCKEIYNEEKENKNKE